MAVTLAGRVGAPPDRREAALRRLVEGLQEFGGNGPLLMDGTRKRHRWEGLQGLRSSRPEVLWGLPHT